MNIDRVVDGAARREQDVVSRLFERAVSPPRIFFLEHREPALGLSVQVGDSHFVDPVVRRRLVMLKTNDRTPVGV